MRLLFLAAALAAFPAFAQTTDVSDLIAENGLRATESQLVGLADPTPSDGFALGGVRFLGAIETALQTRYRTGMYGDIVMLTGIPFLRLPIPENPSPDPFDPVVIEEMFGQILNDMDGALMSLDGISDDDVVSVRFDTSDLWFDIDANGQRDPGEAVFEVLATMLGVRAEVDAPLVIQFDTADAAWLSAYAHLLSGVSEVVLAFQPAEPVREVLASASDLSVLNPPVPGGDDFDARFGTYADLITILVAAIEQQPLPERTQAAHGHFLEMVADNRVFWQRVARETDNDAEWIPNKSQTSALPVDFPADTGRRWLAVLSEAEALLNGDLLIPHWRMGDAAGTNLSLLMDDPPPVDIVGFVQGMSLLPYAEQGPLIQGQSLRLFSELVGGNASLFMVLLN